MDILKWVLLGLLTWILFVTVVVRVIRRFYQFPIPAFITPFIDNPFRRRIQPPQTIVNWMDIREGMSVLEIGPGPGTFTFEAAKQVGDQGRIYAVDIQEPVISALKRKTKQKEIANIELELASAYALPFPGTRFDRIYMITVFGEIPDKQRVLEEIARSLKDDGYFAVGEILLDPDYPRQRTVIGWCKQVGLELTRAHGNMMHYLLVFSKIG